MKQLLVKVLNKGNVVQTIDLSAQSFQVKAMPNVDYLVEDKATGHAPANFKVKRSGNDLVIRGDEESQYLVIKDYYSTDHVAVIGESDGQMYAYNALPTDTTQVATLANDPVTPAHQAWWQGGNSTLATVGLIGLGVVGIAAAAGGGGSSHSDNSPSTTPPTPTNHAPTAIGLSNQSVAENATGAVIGTLTTTDPDTADTFTYSVNDTRFEVVNGQLKLKDGVALDYEVAPAVTVAVTSTDQGGLATTQTFAIAVNNANEAPTAIALTNQSVTENNTGAVVGTLTTTDPDTADTFTYSVNDTRFEVVNGQLKLKDGVALDYEAAPAVTVAVTSTDQGGLTTTQNFSIAVSDVNENPANSNNQNPTAISLTNQSVTENATGAVIGTLTTTDPDTADTFTYSVNDTRFEVVNGQLKLKDGVALDYEAAPAVTVAVTSTDQGGLATTQTFAITVNNVNEAPTALTLSNTTVKENDASVVIGTLTTTDPDAGNTFSYSVSDPRFEVINGQLKLKDGVRLDYETTPTLTVTVTSTDQGGLAVSKDVTINVTDVNESRYIYGNDLGTTINGTMFSNTLVGLKGNDTLNGGEGADTYLFYKGDGQDVINEVDANNIITFNDVNSQDITIDRYQQNITIHYGNNDSVTFNINTVQQINFRDTSWAGNTVAEKLGVSYWNQALSYTLLDDTFSTDKDHNKVIYFSFPTTNPNPSDTTITGWAPFTEEQKAVARETFHNIESLIPVTFVEVASNTLQTDVIYLQNNTQFEAGTLGLGGPNNYGGGDVWLGSTEISDLMRYTLNHEIAHVLGLDHPKNYDNDPSKIYVLNNVENNDLWTVMTYNRLDNVPTPTTYQELDISTLQYLYGVTPTTRAGNDTYTFSSTEGTFVWDGAGNDTLNATAATQSAYIDLHDGSWSYIGAKSQYISDPNQLTINSSTKIENVLGGSANDTLIGNELANMLQGNAGDDTLTGYQGADTIVFTSQVMDATGGNGHDTVTDFHLGNASSDTQADKLDLSQLLVGYTGDHSASSLTSYITVTQQSGNTVISIDRDGTGTAYSTTALITLTNVNTTLDQLATNGQLII